MCADDAVNVWCPEDAIRPANYRKLFHNFMNYAEKCRSRRRNSEFMLSVSADEVLDALTE